MNEHKSQRIRDIAAEAGWRAAVVPKVPDDRNAENILWNLYAIRGKEHIKVVWKGDRFQEASYGYEKYKLYPARTGAVVKLLTGQPNIEVTDGPRNVPWEDNETVTAFNVLVAVVGKDVTWVRQRDDRMRCESCPKESNLGKKHFRLTTTSAGRRVLEWANSFGFQACYLEDIIDVS